MTIIESKNVDVLYFDDLSDAQKADFDWAESDEMFLVYAGDLYPLSNFMRTKDPELLASGWHGVHGTSHFTADLVRVNDDGSYDLGYAHW